NVQDDLVVIFFRMYLVTDPYPAMTFILLGKVNGCNSVCVGKEKFIGMFFAGDPLLDKACFMHQHFFKPFFSNISAVIFNSVDGITKVLIVGTHGLCYSSGCSSCSKEVSHG